MASNILLVEDDVFLQDGLSTLLNREGYQLALMRTLAQAKNWLKHYSCDLIILDVGLPDGNGYDFCAGLRAQGMDMPILFLTARDEEYELVRGFDVGGDDYLTKPFRSMELLARVKSLLRRCPSSETGGINKGLSLDISHLQAKLNGESIYLTPTEFALLHKLVANPGQTLTREQLLESIWDQEGSFIDDNTLSVHISRLREKVGKQAIVTVRGLGYAWRGLDE